MFNKKILGFVFLVSLLLLAVWSPWITEEFAKDRASSSFQTSQNDIEDGCGFNCHGCGPLNTKKTLFGYKVQIEYACGLLKEDNTENHEKKWLFVSLIGTVH